MKVAVKTLHAGDRPDHSVCPDVVVVGARRLLSVRVADDLQHGLRIRSGFEGLTELGLM